MKKSYTNPNLTIDMFRLENIITTSNGGGDITVPQSLANNMANNGITSIKTMSFNDFKKMIVL